MAFIEIDNIGKIEVPDNLSEAEQDRIAEQVVSDYSQARSAVQPEGTGEALAREAGLTARAAINPITAGAGIGAGLGLLVGGVGALPGAAAGATAGLLTDIGSRVYSSLTGKGRPLSEILDEIKTDIGLPKPATPGERMRSNIIEATTGMAGGMGAGKIASQAVSPVIRGVGQVLTERPAMQTASGITSAIGSSLAEQSGAGPVGQAAAGLAGAIIPSAGPLGQASLQQLGRAKATQDEIRRNIESFALAGTTPSAGQATGSGMIQGLETTIGRLPGSVGMMREKAISQQAEIGSKVKQIAEELSRVKEPTIAGAGIQRGVEDVFLPRARAVEGGLYNNLDTVIPKVKPVKASNTYTALEQLSRPIEGAPALSRNQLIMSQEIGALKNDLESDLLNAEGDIPFSALKGLRSKIGEKLSSVQLMSNVSQGQYKKIYGALTEDLRTAAEEAGPKAVTAFNRANKYTRSLHGRMEKLQSFIDKSEPEKIFKAAFEGSDIGATRLRAVMQSIPEPEQKAVAASFISRMGKALPGQQDQAGDIFSTERFLTNWNRLSPEARTTLFGRFGDKYQRNMQKIAETASRIREGSKVLANPAGTAVGGTQTMTYLATAGSLGAGKYGIVTGIAAVGIAGNVLGRAFINPKFVNWLAKNSEIPSYAIPAAISNLNAIAVDEKDPDLAEIATQLRKQEVAKRAAK
jgi:hypothetical protein